MIEDFKTLGRLGKCYLFVENVVGLGLTDRSKTLMAHRLSSGIREMIIKGDYFSGNPSGTLKEIAGKIEENIYKENAAIVNNYTIWVLNYGLVLLCSIFDDFLYEVVQEITTVHPELCSWFTRTEILASFMNKNIKEKISVIVNRLRITEGEFFDFTLFTQEVQIKFKDADFSKLIEIYKKRDKAAHTDSYVIRDINELQKIKDLFDKLVLNLSLKTRQKWGTTSKLAEMIKATKIK